MWLAAWFAVSVVVGLLAGRWLRRVQPAAPLAGSGSSVSSPVTGGPDSSRSSGAKRERAAGAGRTPGKGPVRAGSIFCRTCQTEARGTCLMDQHDVPIACK